MKFPVLAVALIAARAFLSPASAVKQASLHICQGARMYAMSDQVRGDTGWRMKHWDGNHWFGVDVSNGRHHWFARTFWTSSEDCYNQSVEMLAISKGEANSSQLHQPLS